MISQVCLDCGSVVPNENMELHRLRCRSNPRHSSQRSVTDYIEWSCPQCTLMNSADVSVCAACNHDKNDSLPNLISIELTGSTDRTPRGRPTPYWRLRQTSYRPYDGVSEELSSSLQNFTRRVVLQRGREDSPMEQVPTRLAHRRLSMFHQNLVPDMSPLHASTSASFPGAISLHHQSFPAGMTPFHLFGSVDSFSERELRQAITESEGDHLQPQPADFNHVQALPTCILDKSQVDRLPEESKHCVVCMDTFSEGDELRTLPCLHRFHAGCIDRWFEQQGSCPTCKHRIGDNNFNA
mmetsp:Transcript_100634/g.158654  ORF Transcript_100634/g.158654 Transcript_100634/m.158654 type:complete len:296 (-) Transcript_100634:161-1048(-)